MNQDAGQQSMDMPVDILKDDLALGHQETEENVPLEELARELPNVGDGQVPLGELISRVVQAIYAELTEMAETYVALVLFVFLR